MKKSLFSTLLLGVFVATASTQGQDHVARYQLASVAIRRGDAVVDIGCGLGYGTAVLAANSLSRDTLGVDRSGAAIAYAEKSYGCTRPRVGFRVGDAAHLGFIDDRSIDLIVAFELLEHLSDSTDVSRCCAICTTARGPAC